MASFEAINSTVYKYNGANFIMMPMNIGFKKPVRDLTYTANVYRQTTDKLIFKSVISTVR